MGGGGWETAPLSSTLHAVSFAGQMITVGPVRVHGNVKTCLMVTSLPVYRSKFCLGENVLTLLSFS